MQTFIQKTSNKIFQILYSQILRKKIEYRIGLQDIAMSHRNRSRLCFPDADDIESFWINIINKHTAFTEVPHHRWRPTSFGVKTRPARPTVK